MLRKKNNSAIKFIDLQQFHTGFQFEVDYLRKYVDRLADSVNDLANELESEITSDLDSQPEVAENIGPEYFIEASKLKSYFYNSLIVLTHTLYESSLQKLCQQIRQQADSRLCFTQLKNNDSTDKLLLYIKLLTGVCGKSDNGSYSRIKQFQSLRNKIAHENSQLTEASEVERRKKLEKLMVDFNRGVRNDEEPKLSVNFMTGDFSVNSSSLVIEFIDLVILNIQYIYSQLIEIEFSVETNV